MSSIIRIMEHETGNMNIAESPEYPELESVKTKISQTTKE